MRDDALHAGSRRRKFDGERDFALVAQNAELNGLVFVLVLGFALYGKLLAQVADRANALAIDGSNYVAGFEPTLFGSRAGIHVTNQNAFAIGRAEEAAELAVQVFRVDAEPRLATHHQAAAVPFHGRNHRNFRHGKGEASRSAGRGSKHLKRVATLVGFAEGDANGLSAAIAPHGDLRGASGGDFPNHAAELRRAFDALAIDFRHHVIFLEGGFRRRTVRNDGAENDAAFSGKFQFLGGFAGDLVEFHTEPTRAVSVQKNTCLVIVIVASQSGKSLELLEGLAVLRESHLRRRQPGVSFREPG